MLERAETTEVIGLITIAPPLYSTIQASRLSMAGWGGAWLSLIACVALRRLGRGTDRRMKEARPWFGEGKAEDGKMMKRQNHGGLGGKGVLL